MAKLIKLGIRARIVWSASPRDPIAEGPSVKKLILHMKWTQLFGVILRQVAPCIINGRGTFEGPNTILGLLHKATWLVFDGLTKERCIAAYLLAKRVYRMRRKSGL